MSLYTKTCLQGEGAPDDIHPRFWQRNGRGVNLTQSLPYLDKDVFQYEELYANIQMTFKKEFEWIEAMVRVPSDIDSKEILISHPLAKALSS